MSSARRRRRRRESGRSVVANRNLRRVAVEPLEGRQLMAVDLVSVAVGGGPGNGASGESSVSADGRFVAFSSGASNLIATDGNGAFDIFVRDRNGGGSTILISQNADNSGPANGKSYAPAISADGKFVAFVSEADNIVAGDTNQRPDVFVRDIAAGTTRLVTRSLAGGFGNGFSGEPAISADGRHVAFTSSSTNLTQQGDGNTVTDVFVRDMNAGVTRYVSNRSDNVLAGNDLSFDPSISADGRFVAFRSKATNIAGTISEGGAINVYLRDTDGAGSTRLVSVNQAGASGSADSTSSSVSANGKFVVFRSVAGDLTPLDTNLADDVFLRDVDANTTTLLSINQQRTASGRGRSAFPSVSSDGHFAAFSSLAPDLIAGDVNNREDVFLRDLQAGPITLLSVTPGGAPANGHSFDTFVSSDGKFVAFSSDASDLIAGDGNNATDVFVAGTPEPTTDTTPPTATVSATQDPATNGTAFYDFRVELADNVALNTVQLLDLSVTPPGGGTPIVADFQSVLGSGSAATAIYRIAAPGGAIDAADNGAYTVSVPATGVIKDVANNSVAAGPIGSFTITAADANAPDLTVSFNGAQPASVIGGKKSTAKVRVKNEGVNIAQNNIKIALYLSDNDTFDAGDREVVNSTKKVKLKTGKVKQFGLKFTYPTDIGNGGYFLIARVDSDNVLQEIKENNNTASAVGTGGAPIDLKQPFVDLVPADTGRPFGSLTANGAVISSVDVRNDGNIKFAGDVTIRLLASNNPDTTGDDVEVTTFTKRLSIANGKAKRVTLKYTLPASLTAGNYELISQVDPSNSVTEGNDGNNSGKSAGWSVT